MHKGFLDTALKTSAVGALVVATLCVGSLGLSQLSPPEDGAPNSALAQADIRLARSGVSPSPGGASSSEDFSLQLDRIGNRLEQINDRMSRVGQTQSDVAQLGESLATTRRTVEETSSRLQNELTDMRVASEVELRDVNRQLGNLSNGYDRIERSLDQHRNDLASAIESHQQTVTAKVAAMDGSLSSVKSELAQLRTASFPGYSARSAAPLARNPGQLSAPVIASRSGVPSATGSQESRLEPSPTEAPAKLVPSPSTLLDGIDTEGAEPLATPDSPPGSAAPDWQRPDVELPPDGSSSGEHDRLPGTVFQKSDEARWNVTPMSHTTVVDSKEAIQQIVAASPSSETQRTVVPPLPFPEPLQQPRAATSSSGPQPLASTLAPSIPEVIDTPPLPNDQSIQIPETDDVNSSILPADRVFDIKATVIHLEATRPVDLEPAGARTLNPASTATTYGTPWTHNAVAYELLRLVKDRSMAGIVGRGSTTIRPDETAVLAIGHLCPHCNEVNGFENGDRLVVEAGSGNDRLPTFHISSRPATDTDVLHSFLESDLTPEHGGTFVITEEGVEGTVGTSATDPGTEARFMQRLVVLSFYERSSPDDPTSFSEAGADLTFEGIPVLQLAGSSVPAVEPVSVSAGESYSSGKTASSSTAYTPLRRLETPVVFLPPPEPASSVSAPREPEQEYVLTHATVAPSPQQLHADRLNGDYCEICQKVHAEKTPVNSKQPTGVIGSLIRRVRGSSESESSPVTNAAYTEASDVKARAAADYPLATEDDSTRKPKRRRYVTKPGNRRSSR